jgi:hypothetical protein
VYAVDTTNLNFDVVAWQYIINWNCEYKDVNDCSWDYEYGNIQLAMDMEAESWVGGCIVFLPLEKLIYVLLEKLYKLGRTKFLNKIGKIEAAKVKFNKKG